MIVSVSEEGFLDSRSEGRVGEEEETVEDFEVSEEVEIEEVDGEEGLRDERSVGEEGWEDCEGGEDGEGGSGGREDVGFGVRGGGVGLEEVGEEGADVGGLRRGGGGRWRLGGLRVIEDEVVERRRSEGELEGRPGAWWTRAEVEEGGELQSCRGEEGGWSLGARPSC